MKNFVSRNIYRLEQCEDDYNYELDSSNVGYVSNLIITSIASIGCVFMITVNWNNGEIRVAGLYTMALVGILLVFGRQLVCRYLYLFGNDQGLFFITSKYGGGSYVFISWNEIRSIEIPSKPIGYESRTIYVYTLIENNYELPNMLFGKAKKGRVLGLLWPSPSEKIVIIIGVDTPRVKAWHDFARSQCDEIRDKIVFLGGR